MTPVILKLDLFAINIDQVWSSLDFCLTCTKQLTLTWKWNYFLIVQSNVLKVSVKENEVPTEKNSGRASIFATKGSYISN